MVLGCAYSAMLGCGSTDSSDAPNNAMGIAPMLTAASLPPLTVSLAVTTVIKSAAGERSPVFPPRLSTLLLA